MFNTRKEPKLENIYKYVSEFDIFKYLIPEASLKRKFSLREENIPSCSLKKYRGNLYLKDFGNPNQEKAETWIGFLKRTKGFNYSQCINYIINGLNLPLRCRDQTEIKHTTSVHKKIPRKQKKPTTIITTRKPFNKKEIEYWNKYLIPIKKVKEKGIFPTNSYYINNKKIWVRNQITFVYPYWKVDGVMIYKIYSPFNKRFKWISNVNEDIIDNINFIKKPKKHLIIQTSRKDIMLCELYRDKFGIFENYDFVAPPSESNFFSDEKWSYLQNTYNKIIYFANNDFEKENNPGITYAKKIKSKYKIDFIHTPDNTASDISDVAKLFGFDKTFKILKKLDRGK